MLDYVRKAKKKTNKNILWNDVFVYKTWRWIMNEQFFRDCSTVPFWDVINHCLRKAHGLNSWYIKTCKWSTNGSVASPKLERLIKMDVCVRGEDDEKGLLLLLK